MVTECVHANQPSKIKIVDESLKNNCYLRGNATKEHFSGITKELYMMEID